MLQFESQLDQPGNFVNAEKFLKEPTILRYLLHSEPPNPHFLA
jgi:hypothetical protein